MMYIPNTFLSTCYKARYIVVTVWLEVLKLNRVYIYTKIYIGVSALGILKREMLLTHLILC